MSNKLSIKDVKLKGADSFFGNKKEESSEKIQMIKISELSEFEGHPFKIREDKLQEMADSIKQYGVLMPGIVRKKAYGGYEIIAGHTRKAACEIAGLDTMPVIVKDISDDEATILMVDSNIQREDILPSEKAKAYKMKHEAMKSQGMPGNSLRQIGEENGENYKSVQRYIWLARLIDELLEMVDEKKLGVSPGVDLSWLPEDEQRMVYEVIHNQNRSLSIKESAIIKQLSKDGKLDEVTLLRMFVSEKQNKRRVSLDQKRLDQYFTPDITEQEIMDIIISLLDTWKTEQES